MDRKETNGESILSPSFRVQHTSVSEETKWQIQLYPRGDVASIDNGHYGQSLPLHVSVFLRGISDIKKDYVDVRVSIVDCNLNRIYETKLHHQLNTKKVSENENMCFGESKVFLRSAISFGGDESKIGKILPGKSLTLAFEIDVLVDDEYEDSLQSDEANQKGNNDSQTKSKEEAIKDFGKMFENKELCDLEIDCDGKVFSCHQIILSARSPVFSAMFKIEMKESESGKVSIKDIKPDTMAEMLYFIYTGLVNETALTVTNAVELLFAADKYQLDTLKDICQDKLSSVLDAENAIEFLILGEKYQTPKLKDSALMEVVHHMPEIADTEAYRKLVDYPDLALEIPKAMFK